MPGRRKVVDSVSCVRTAGSEGYPRIEMEGAHAVMERCPSGRLMVSILDSLVRLLKSALPGPISVTHQRQG
jgi:hypothetical protein